jgi:hypothetical protein
MNGGVCQESNIYYQEYTATTKTLFLTQQSGAVSTTSFNIDKGLLQTECYLPEANIMMMK